MLKVVQHTPAVSVRDGTSNVSHDLLAKLLEKLALQWFGEIVSDHFLSGQIFNHNIAFLHLICNKKVTNVNCSGPLTRALLTIVLQQNGALVVLTKNFFLISQTWASKNCLIQRIGVEQSSTPTNLATVLLQLLKFCFKDLVQ